MQKLRLKNGWKKKRMKYFNQNFKNINSISNEMEFFLSCISPQAKKMFDIKKLNADLSRVLNDLKMDKIAGCCKVVDEKNDCLLIQTNAPAVTAFLNLRKNEIKERLKVKSNKKIAEIFIKN